MLVLTAAATYFNNDNDGHLPHRCCCFRCCVFVANTHKHKHTFDLYYTGVKDTVKCNSCGVELSDWEPADDPLTEHKNWYPTCPFIVKNECLSKQ